MILDGILFVLKGILEILLAPLTVINIGVDFIASIPVITQFIQVVAYVLPWSNILPLVVLVVAIFVFRALIAFFKTLWAVIPFL